MNQNKLDPKDNFNEDLLKKIKNGQIKMRPKFYFISETVLYVTVAVLLFLAITFLISFVIFVLRSNAVWLLPSFGWPGIKILLLSFPWIIFLVSILFILILETLIRHFGFSWRRPMIYSVSGILIIVTATGICLALTPLHDNALKSALKSNLPVAGALYRNYYAAPVDNLYQGTVSGLTDENNFSIQTPQGQKLKIEIPTSTRDTVIKQGKVQNDDCVMIVGEKNGQEIQVFGVHKFKKGEEPLFHQCLKPAQDEQEKQGKQEGD